MNEPSSQTGSGEAAGRALIFESYGWSDAAEIAARIRRSLEEAGFEVWLDSDHIRPDEPDFWRPLQSALESCRLVIALLSPHSVRLEDDLAAARNMSVCHNELILAVRMKKAVVSVTVIDCEPPLAINQYDPIDMTDWQSSPAAYREGFEQILHWIGEGLADRRRYRVYVDNLSHDRLSFPEEQSAASGFVGREWLMQRIAGWLDGDRSAMVVEAEPGSGKTALVAELLRRNPDDRILAYHFCNAQRRDTVDARRFVRSLAAMLCATVPAYRARLRGSEELVRALKGDGGAESMLWQGVLEPLGQMTMAGARAIVVDGLDEAVDAPAGDGTVSIARLLAQAMRHFPPWLKLLVTTRPHDRVLPLFQAAERCQIDGSVAAQRGDVEAFVVRRLGEAKLAARLGGAADAVADRLAGLSGGNFQYAETVLDELASGGIGADELGRLPPSLAGLYHNRAEARFPDGEGFAEARRVLAVLIAALQPLSRSELARITGLERERELADLLGKLAGFVFWDTDEGSEGVFRIAHKSVGDWLTRPAGGFDRFKVEPELGRELILADCRGWESHEAPYAMRYLVAHLIEAGLCEEALGLVTGGFFERRHGLIEAHHDLTDARALTLALVATGEEEAIVGLARTDNLCQRDGVAAGLAGAPAAADDFVERVVRALLEAR
jgi:hypothetical protein